MSNNVLIFGAAGQDGYYLSEICTREGFSLSGVSRSGGNWQAGDVSDTQFVKQLIRSLRCSYVFHLAANSTTEHSALYENFSSIAKGTINILESCREYVPDARVFISGSALQFVNDGRLVSVDMPFSNSSAYVIARNYAVSAARYFRTLGLRAYVGYFCHHDSPRRSQRHLSMKIVRAAQEIRKGAMTQLEIDYPGVTKEFNFAGDLMEAVWLLVNQDEVFECVIGSGRGHSILDWVRICFELNGLNWNDHVVKTGLGKAPFDRLVGDPTVVQSLGWQPRVNINELASMMMVANG